MIRKDIVYIAGPMTGLTGFNRSSFNRAANIIKQQGFEVRNPACLPIDWANYDHYIEISLAMLRQCDWIVFLPGSATSKGVGIEYAFAANNGIRTHSLLLPKIWTTLEQEFVANGGKL